MLSDDIKHLKESKWLSISIQSSLLGLNFLLASQKIYNSYLLLSVAIIFSLFLLQSSNHRFLYFNPFNHHVHVATPHFDTFILYTFTYLAGILLILSITHEYKIEFLEPIELCLKTKILWSYLFLLLILPLLSKIFGRKLIAKDLAKKLKNKKFQYKDNCNECGFQNTFYENIVVAWNDLRVVRKCLNCDKESKKEIKTNLRIG